MFKPLLVAIQFMTRLPVPASWLPETFDDKTMGQSVLTYPVVGFIIGLILWGMTWFMSGLAPLVTAALLLLVWILITGALHLDGLADCADAWVGGHGDRERTLAIMKDSFIGPVGVVVLVSVLLVKFAALASLKNPALAVLIAPVMARTLVILLFLTTPYVRENGLGQQQSRSLPMVPAYTIVLFIATGLLAITGVGGVVLLICLVAVFIFLRWQFVKTIGGMTGDTAGAMLEIMEAAVLLIFTWIL